VTNNSDRPTRSLSASVFSASLLRSSGGILLVTILLFLLSWFVQPESLGSAALSGMIPFASILAIVALGQTLVIQQGGIDLSVPGIVSLSGVIVSYYSSNEPGMSGSTLGSAVFYAIAAALIAGLVNGLLVAYARVAPIVATLGMNAVLYGFDVGVSGGTPVQVPESLSQFVDYKIFGVSTLAYIAVGVTIVLTFLVKKTVFGRRFEAVGANPRTARAAGVLASRYQLAAYAGASVLYCMAGIFLGGLMHLPSAFQGDSYLMPSIAAVVLWRWKPHRVGDRCFVSDATAAARADDRCGGRRSVPVSRRRHRRRCRHLQHQVEEFGGLIGPLRRRHDAAGRRRRAFVTTHRPRGSSHRKVSSE
jgi:ribose transport system permease protein